MFERRPVQASLLAVSLSALLGCVADLQVRRIPREMADQAKGLVVQTNVPHELVAVFPKEPGSRELDTQVAAAMLPSTKDYYELNYCGALFRTTELKVELHPDSTVKKVEMNSTLQLADQLGAITEGAGEIATTKKAFDDAEPSKVEELTTESSRLKNEVLIRMQQANLDALELGKPLPYPDIAK